ncbi:MAG: hypothetical protein WC604_02705 [Candidatus Gracilibacteria bacterium]
MSFLEKIREKLPFEIGKSETSEGKEANLLLGKPEPFGDEKLSANVPPKKNLIGALLDKIRPKREKTSALDAADALAAPGEEGYSPLIASALKTEKSPTDERILDAPPEIDESLLEGVEPPKSILLYVMKGAFAFIVVLGIVAILFFMSQTTHRLDFVTNSLNIPSVLDELDKENAEIKDLQTELNIYRFLQGKFYLNQVSYYGDEYLRNYYIKWNSTIPEEERKAALAEMTKLKEKIVKAFDLAAEKLTKKKGIVLIDLSIEDDSQYEVIFENLLSQKLEEKASGLASESANEAASEDVGSTVDSGGKLYSQTRQLVSNTELFALLQNTNIKALDEHEFKDLIKQINSIVENELGSIQKIKEARINWSDIMNQIELVTSYVDQYFSEGYYEALGGIQYTSYDFDTSTGEITITGVTKRYDTTNFTMITNLIDQLNASSYFTGVEMKSFTKSGSADEGYTSTLSLKVQLQKEALEDPDDKIVPDAIPEFLEKETGVSVSGISVSGINKNE